MNVSAVGRALGRALDGEIGPYGLHFGVQVMPSLSAEDYATLKADIQANGITVPVLITADDEVIDGHHRLQIADELGLDSDDIPWTVTSVDPRDAAAKRDLAYRLNAHRRHLTRAEKREALERSMRADPQLSDRRHAGRVCVSPSTAGAVRSDLAAAGEVSNLDTRIGKNGISQPATKPIRESDPEPERAAAPIRPAPAPRREPNQRPVQADSPPPAVADDRAQRVFDGAASIARILAAAELPDIVGAIDPAAAPAYAAQLERCIAQLDRLLDAMQTAPTGGTGGASP